MLVYTDSCYDSHCHLSPDITRERFEEDVKPILESQTWPINLMMTNHIDSPLITSAIEDPTITCNKQVLLNVGIHPWFSHLYTFDHQMEHETDDEYKIRHYGKVLEVYSKNKHQDGDFEKLLVYLPKPFPIVDIIEQFKGILKNCKGFENRVNIGEIGIDKLARIPESGYLGNPSYPSLVSCGLSNFKVSMKHQVNIFKIQLYMSIDGGWEVPKRISIHCVGCHGKLYEILKEFDLQKMSNNEIPAVVMHSYSGSVDNAKMMLTKLKNLHVWFGLSDVVNLNRYNDENTTDFIKLKKLISVIHDHLLVETDLGIDRMLEGHYQRIQNIIDKLVKLGVNEASLFDNWRSFIQ